MNRSEEPPSEKPQNRVQRVLATGGRPLTDDERKELRRLLSSAASPGDEVIDLLGRFLLAEVVNGALTSLSLNELWYRLIELVTATLAAERGTIVLLDIERNELFSRVMQGDEVREIRIPRGSGIAGAVLESGRSEIVTDAYADLSFNSTVDQHTSYRTRTLIGVPLRKSDGTVMGVFEILNKREGISTPPTLRFLRRSARRRRQRSSMLNCMRTNVKNGSWTDASSTLRKPSRPNSSSTSCLAKSSRRRGCFSRANGQVYSFTTRLPATSYRASRQEAASRKSEFPPIWVWQGPPSPPAARSTCATPERTRDSIPKSTR
jgi:GAF domain